MSRRKVPWTSRDGPLLRIVAVPRGGRLRLSRSWANSSDFRGLVASTYNE